jgi:hypothetical protein
VRDINARWVTQIDTDGSFRSVILYITLKEGTFYDGFSINYNIEERVSA